MATGPLLMTLSAKIDMAPLSVKLVSVPMGGRHKSATVVVATASVRVVTAGPSGIWSGSLTCVIGDNVVTAWVLSTNLVPITIAGSRTLGVSIVSLGGSSV